MSAALDHSRLAYQRTQRYAIDAALKVARIDQRGAPARCRPTDYLATVMWLLERDTYEKYQEIEQQVAEHGGTTERKLSDFAGGGE